MVREADSPRAEDSSSQGSRQGSQSGTPASGATEGELRTIFGTSISPAEALDTYHDASARSAPYRAGASTAYAEGRSVRSPSTPARVTPADASSPAPGTVQYCDDVTVPMDSDETATPKRCHPKARRQLSPKSLGWKWSRKLLLPNQYRIALCPLRWVPIHWEAPL